MTAEQLKAGSKRIAVDVVLLCHKLKSFPESNVIKYQLIKAVSSVAANEKFVLKSPFGEKNTF